MGEKTYFKDMEERTLDISPISIYYLYHQKQSEQILEHDQKLRNIFQCYFYKNAIEILRICLAYQNENPENSLLNHLIPLLIHIAKNKPLEEYATEKQISMRQIYTLLSFYQGDKKWENYANFLALSPQERSICFREIKADSYQFKIELESILEMNKPLTEEAISKEALIQMLCLFSLNGIIFIDQAILESNYIGEATRNQIKNLIGEYQMGNHGNQKNYKIKSCMSE